MLQRYPDLNRAPYCLLHEASRHHQKCARTQIRRNEHSTTYPDCTTESWTYGNAGETLTHVDGNSHTITYGYDHRGLMTSVSYPAGTGISYTYDVAGQKTAMTDATGSTSYTPDAAGRITSVTTPNGTVGYA